MIGSDVGPTTGSRTSHLHRCDDEMKTVQVAVDTELEGDVPCSRSGSSTVRAVSRDIIIVFRRRFSAAWAFQRPLASLQHPDRSALP